LETALAFNGESGGETHITLPYPVEEERLKALPIPGDPE
jgi:hypothetical protein